MNVLQICRLTRKNKLFGENPEKKFNCSSNAKIIFIYTECDTIVKLYQRKEK